MLDESTWLGPQQEVLPNESALRTLFGKYFGEVHALDRFPDGKKCFIWFVSADDAGEVIKQARGDILKFPEEGDLQLFVKPGLADPSKRNYERQMNIEKSLTATTAAPSQAKTSSFLGIDVKPPGPYHWVTGKDHRVIIGIANRGTYEAHISLEEISTENSNCWNLDFANKKISGAKITRKGTSSPVAVGPGKSLDFAVKFRSANAGLYTYKLHINCHRRYLGQKTFKTFELTAQVVDASLVKFVSHTSKNDGQSVSARGVWDGKLREMKPAPPATRGDNQPILDFEGQFVRQLQDWAVPEHMQRDVDIADKISGLNPWSMPESYKERLHNLLYMEEAQQRKQMRKFDIPLTVLEPIESYQARGTMVIPRQPAARVKVDGLAERRPSVLYNDIIVAWRNEERIEWEGRVFLVEKDSVLVMFDPEFHDSYIQKRVPINIRFMFPRLQMRRMHQAIENVMALVMFPKGDLLGKVSRAPQNIRPPEVIHELDQPCFDDRINQNPEQLRAVVSVTNRRSVYVPLDRKYTVGLVPFLLFGPFGTGKTNTLIEMIRMAKEKCQGKILVAAQSNSAADFIALKLATFLKPSEMLRLYPIYYKFLAIDVKLRDYVRYDFNTDMFPVPQPTTLSRFSVIVTTCESSSLLYSVGMKQGSFSHIFIDEAAQLLEPMALIPLQLAIEKTMIVLAGDHKQLGPSVFSDSARAHKLDRSLMERLYSFRQLDYDAPDQKLMVRLRRNYRCHSTLVKFTSSLFYDDTLIAMADDRELEKYWTAVDPPSTCSIMVHGVKGKCEQTADSASWFNLVEAEACLSILSQALQHVRVDDIGVIAPYRKQVEVIRDVVTTRRIGRVKVGSVGDFQGHERKILIISLTRASRKIAETHDQLHDLGLLLNPKRMNTALTRAAALIIVVGDPFIMEGSEVWNPVLRISRERNNYRGIELSENYFKKREREDEEQPIHDTAGAVLEKKEEAEDDGFVCDDFWADANDRDLVMDDVGGIASIVEESDTIVHHSREDSAGSWDPHSPSQDSSSDTSSPKGRSKRSPQGPNGVGVVGGASIGGIGSMSRSDQPFLVAAKTGAAEDDDVPHEVGSPPSASGTVSPGSIGSIGQVVGSPPDAVTPVGRYGGGSYALSHDRSPPVPSAKPHQPAPNALPFSARHPIGSPAPQTGIPQRLSAAGGGAYSNPVVPSTSLTSPQNGENAGPQWYIVKVFFYPPDAGAMANNTRRELMWTFPFLKEQLTLLQVGDQPPHLNIQVFDDSQLGALMWFLLPRHQTPQIQIGIRPFWNQNMSSEDQHDTWLSPKFIAK